MTPNEWILFGEVGISSRTIWAVLTGTVTERPDSHKWIFDVPHDPDDLRRCMMLISLFPEWEGRLREVADVFPKWGPLVARWPEVKAAFFEEWASPGGRCERTYELLRELENEGFRADGWTQTGPGSWTKKKAQ